MARALQALSASLLASATAAACPVCDSETAARVGALAFGPDFLWFVGATLAPAPALASWPQPPGRRPAC